MPAQIVLEAKNEAGPAFEDARKSLQEVAKAAGITSDAGKALNKELKNRAWNDYKKQVKEAADELLGIQKPTKAAKSDLKDMGEAAKKAANEMKSMGGGSGAGGGMSVSAALVGVAAAAVAIKQAFETAKFAAEKFNEATTFGANSGIKEWGKLRASIDGIFTAGEDALSMLQSSDFGRGLASAADTGAQALADAIREIGSGLTGTQELMLDLQRNMGLLSAQGHAAAVQALKDQRDAAEAAAKVARFNREAATFDMAIEAIEKRSADARKAQTLDAIEDYSKLVNMLDDQKTAIDDLKHDATLAFEDKKQLLQDELATATAIQQKIAAIERQRIADVGKDIENMRSQLRAAAKEREAVFKTGGAAGELGDKVSNVSDSETMRQLAQQRGTKLAADRGITDPQKIRALIAGQLSGMERGSIGVGKRGARGINETDIEDARLQIRRRRIRELMESGSVNAVDAQALSGLIEGQSDAASSAAGMRDRMRAGNRAGRNGMSANDRAFGRAGRAVDAGLRDSGEVEALTKTINSQAAQHSQAMATANKLTQKQADLQLQAVQAQIKMNSDQESRLQKIEQAVKVAEDMASRSGQRQSAQNWGR